MTSIEPSLATRLDDIEKRVGAYRAQSWRSAWVVMAVFLLVLALIVSGVLFFIPATTIAQVQAHLQPNAGVSQSTSTTTVGGEADFIKVVIPLLAVAFGFAVGFLGLKRLEQFDSEINSLRSSLQSQPLEERRLAASDRDRLVKANEDRFSEARSTQAGVLNRIEKRQEELKAEIGSAASTSLAEIKDEREAAKTDRQSHRQEMLSELAKRTEEIKNYVKIAADDLAREAVKPLAKEALDDFAERKVEMETKLTEVNSRLKEFGWLKQHEGELESLVGITSAGVAHTKVVEFFQAKKIDVALKLAERVRETRMGGSGDDFHNLAAEYAKNDYFEQATAIVTLGLTFFPTNVDLIADGIKYATNSGQIRVAETLENQLLAIDRSKWNWRAFVFLADYYGVTNNDEKSFETYQLFRSGPLGTSDERGYSEEVELLIKRGNIVKAEQLAQEGLEKCLQAPQCAFHLAKLKFEQGKCDEAVHFASVALSQNIIDQPTVNMSSIVWYRGAARVKQCLIMAAEQVVELTKLEQLALLAVNDLRLSVSMPRAIRQHSHEATVQLKLLRQALEQVGSERYRDPEFQDLEDPQTAVLSALAQMLKAREHVADEGMSVVTRGNVG